MNNIILAERGFAKEEFEHRLIRAQKIMKSYQLDGILLTVPQNIRYFTGYESQFWESPTRPWFVVVPASGKPIGIVPEIGESEFNKTWLDEIKSWPSPTARPPTAYPSKPIFVNFSALSARISLNVEPC